jgi:hypothetical protein
MQLPSLQRFVKPILVSAIIVIGVLGIAHITFAADAGSTFIGDIAYSAVSKGIASVLYFILAGVAWGVGMMSQALNFTVNFSLDPNLFIIINLWKIVRDFTNMFFVLILIIMAFSLIFDVSALGIPGFGGIDTKKLIAKFIIAALLINFSLTIGGLIIDGTNEINKVFLGAIGDFSSRLGQALNPSATLLGVTPEQLTALSVQGGQVTDVGLAHIVKMVSSIILGMIILFSLIVATFFSLVRIPILWMLLIFSPIAWISGILPATEKINKEWWNNFIGWNMFLPVFLFFLYVGLYFMSYQDQVLGGIATGFKPESINQSLITGAGVTFQTIFYYFLVAFTLLAGTKYALDAASGGGKLLTGMVSRGRDFAWGLPPFNRVRAIGQVYQKEFQEIQKEGIGRSKLFGKELKDLGVIGKNVSKIYQGEKGQERLREEEGASFGIKGYESDKLLTKKIGEKKKEFKEKDFSAEKLLSTMREKEGKRDMESQTEYYAAAEVLLEKKRLPFDMASQLLKRYKVDAKPAAGAFQDRLSDQIMDKASKESFQSENEFKTAYDMVPEDVREKFLDTVKSRNMIWAIEQRIKSLEEEYKKEVEKRRKDPKYATKSDQEILNEIIAESSDVTNPSRFRTRVKEVFSSKGGILNPTDPAAKQELIEGMAGGFSAREMQNLMNDPMMNSSALEDLLTKDLSKLSDKDQKKALKDIDNIQKTYKAIGLQLNEKRINDINKNISAQQRKNFDAVIKDLMAKIADAKSGYRDEFDKIRMERKATKERAKDFARAIGEDVKDKS